MNINSTIHILSCRAPDTPNWRKLISLKWQWSTWGTCSASRWAVSVRHTHPLKKKWNVITCFRNPGSNNTSLISSISLSQQHSQQTPPSSANTEPDSTNAWTRSPASSPPQRGWMRRWGRGFSTTCPAAWVRWCPWTISNRLHPSRRTWLSLFMCSFHPLCPSAAAPNSVLPNLCPPRSSVASSWFPPLMDSLPFWSLTPLLAPPPRLSFLFTQTRECLSRWTPVRCTAAQPRLHHLRSTAWHLSLGDPKRSPRSGSAQARRAASLCGGLGYAGQNRRLWIRVWKIKDQSS